MNLNYFNAEMQRRGDVQTLFDEPRQILMKNGGNQMFEAELKCLWPGERNYFVLHGKSPVGSSGFLGIGGEAIGENVIGGLVHGHELTVHQGSGFNGKEKTIRILVESIYPSVPGYLGYQFRCFGVVGDAFDLRFHSEMSMTVLRGVASEQFLGGVFNGNQNLFPARPG